MRKRGVKLAALLVSAALVLGTTACGTEKEPQGKQEQEKEQEKEPEIKDVSTADIEKAVAEAYGEEYVPSMEFTADDLKNALGIDPELCEEYMAKGPMISAQVDTFFAFKAKSGKAEEVKKAVEAYQEKLKSDTFQYPMNIPKIQASEVKVYGDYVFFIMLGFIDDTEEQTEEQMLEAFREENKKAIEAIEGVLYGI